MICEDEIVNEEDVGSALVSGNRYNALNNLNDNDGRRGYGRSPARGDSRSGSSRMGGDRDRRDRDRDMRRPVARSSMEERERALASTRWDMVDFYFVRLCAISHDMHSNIHCWQIPPSVVEGVQSIFIWLCAMFLLPSWSNNVVLRNKFGFFFFIYERNHITE